MTERRYQRRLATTAWLLTITVLVSLVISVIVGWQANSNLERGRDIAIAVVSAVLTYVAVRWCGGVARRFAHRYLMTDDKAAQLIDEALSKGLLPTSYERSPRLDRRVAKTIRYDRKIGLSEAEIERDLEDLV